MSKFINIVSNASYCGARVLGYNSPRNIMDSLNQDVVLKEAAISVVMGRNPANNPIFSLAISALSHISNFAVLVIDGKYNGQTAFAPGATLVTASVVRQPPGSNAGDPTHPSTG